MSREAVRRFALCALTVIAFVGSARAATPDTLRIGIALETDTLDPHFHWFGAAIALTRETFEPLVTIGQDGEVVPLLATSWRPVGDAAWAFELRTATFSDGTPLTPDDVAFSLQRAADVPNSPTGFGAYLRSVAAVETTGPHSIIVRTHGPAPMLPRQLSAIGIVSRRHGANATTADYNSLKATVGTGPYKITAWDRGGGVSLERNELYWGDAPAWPHVRIQYIPNPGARVSALLAGDVDLIDQVPAPDVARLKAEPNLHVTSSVSYAIVGFLPDVTERVPPYITDNSGQPLTRNPLADLKVRQAIALSINRQALVDRVLNGQAAVATQFMQPGQYGYDPSIADPVYDPSKAKLLLADAGYPNGFHMTIQCQQRFYNADAVCQAIAQMLTRIGIRTEPDPMPHSMYVTRSIKHEFSFGTTFSLVDMGDPSSPLVANLATYGGANGWGSTNRGRYSNKALDDLFERAQVEIDPQKREHLLQDATRIALGDVAIILVFRPLNLEAMRSDLDHQPLADGYVLAADVHRRVAQAARQDKTGQ